MMIVALWNGDDPRRSPNGQIFVVPTLQEQVTLCRLALVLL